MLRNVVPGCRSAISQIQQNQAPLRLGLHDRNLKHQAPGTVVRKGELQQLLVQHAIARRAGMQHYSVHRNTMEPRAHLLR